MAKKGGSKHFKRIGIPRILPIRARKSPKWLLAPVAGPHPKLNSVALGVLCRDMLHLGDNLREIKRILAAGSVLIDGKAVRDIRRPVGLMDLIEAPKDNKAWRMQIGKDGKFLPNPVAPGSVKFKLAKVVKKTVVPKGKVSITTHDGRTMLLDNKVKVGSTLKLGLPGMKMAGQLPMEAGARCLVTHGKHAGGFAVLEQVIERVGSMDPEARMRSGNESFITVIKYLFVVDEEFN